MKLEWQSGAPDERRYEGPMKMPADLQSFPEAVDQGLEQGFIVGYGLQYVSIRRHIADGPLAQTRTAQPEDVTEGGRGGKHESWDALELCHPESY